MCHLIIKLSLVTDAVKGMLVINHRAKKELNVYPMTNVKQLSASLCATYNQNNNHAPLLISLSLLKRTLHTAMLCKSTKRLIKINSIISENRVTSSSNY